jgi:hypothetical protein
METHVVVGLVLAALTLLANLVLLILVWRLAKTPAAAIRLVPTNGKTADEITGVRELKQVRERLGSPSHAA